MLVLVSVLVGRYTEVIRIVVLVLVKIQENSLFVTLAVKEKLNEFVELTPLLGLLLFAFSLFFICIIVLLADFVG
jgi:hypothetical protein